MIPGLVSTYWCLKPHHSGSWAYPTGGGNSSWGFCGRCRSSESDLGQPMVGLEAKESWLWSTCMWWVSMVASGWGFRTSHSSQHAGGQVCILAQLPSYYSSFFKINFLLKDNCFTEFSCFPSNLNLNQPQVYIHPLQYEPPSHLPPIPPPRLIQSPCLSFLSHTANYCRLSILHMVCKFPCYSFHTSHPLLPSPHVHRSILYVSPLLPCKIKSSEPFF